MNELVGQLRLAEPHYIRCIKPNDLQKAAVFEPERVRHQARYLGLLENVRVRRAGFAFRQPFTRFVARYKMLCKETWPYSTRSGSEDSKVGLRDGMMMMMVVVVMMMMMSDGGGHDEDDTPPMILMLTASDCAAVAAAVVGRAVDDGVGRGRWRSWPGGGCVSGDGDDAQAPTPSSAAAARPSQAILDAVAIAPEAYKFGKTKIFIVKPVTLFSLEELRERKLHDVVRSIQVRHLTAS